MRLFSRAVVLSLAGAFSVAAAEAAGPGAKAAPSPELRAAGTVFPKTASVPRAYGTDAPTRISLSSYAFQGNASTDVIIEDGQTYRYFPSPGTLTFSASVSIPAGARIVGIGFDNCDNAPAVTMSMNLMDRFGDHLAVNVGAVGSTDGAGCGFDNFTLAVPYDHDDNVDHVFEIFIAQNAVDPTAKFRSAYVDYVLRVSPAPAVATFPDVPTGDFGFQYVEALVASGITGGCGGGLYCPDASVTRRQMAIFIAKALGLHWPN